MPYQTEHAARIKSPDLFIKESMRSKTLSEGIRVIVGKLITANDKMTAQSYRFNKSNFTVDEAKKWLTENNVKYVSFEPAKKEIQSFKRSFKLQCYAVTISAQEILANIPINTLSEIKENNPHPYFRAYSIMHEGTARPRVIGEKESLPTLWTRKVIQSAKNIIKRGVQFFVGHNADNSTRGRRSIGEVVGNFQKMINDKLHNIAIGYFPDRIEADKYNVCSIEGGVIAQDFQDYSLIREIKNISGIALAHSSYERPAFPGAVYMAAVQAFDDDPADLPPSKNKNVRRSQNMDTITFEDVKKAVRNMNIFPSQLFAEPDLRNDRTFSKIFDDVAKAAKEGMIPKSDYDKEILSRDETIKKLTKDVSIVTAHDKLKKSLPEGLTDSQKNFINKKFAPETMESLDDSKLKEFVTNAIKEYSEYASLFNAKPENNGNPKPPTQKNEGDDMDEIDKIVNDVAIQPQGV